MFIEATNITDVQEFFFILARVNSTAWLFLSITIVITVVFNDLIHLRRFIIYARIGS